MQQTKSFILIFIITTLIGCSATRLPEQETPTDKAKPKEEETQKPSNKPPTSFNISGAIAVNNKGKGWNATLNWRQAGANYYTIRLSGPLGGKTVIIKKAGSNITYQEGSKTIKARSDSELLKKKANINLPVNNLYYWVRGIPAPGGSSHVKKDEYGNVQVIQQNGFTVTYSKFIKSSNGTLLPAKIRITGKSLTIKLVIKHWE